MTSWYIQRWISIRFLHPTHYKVLLTGDHYFHHDMTLLACTNNTAVITYICQFCVLYCLQVFTTDGT